MQQRHLPPGRPRADDPVERLLRVDRQAPGQGGQARAQPGDHDPCTGVIEGTCRHLVRDRMDLGAWVLIAISAVGMADPPSTGQGKLALTSRRRPTACSCLLYTSD